MAESATDLLHKAPSTLEPTMSSFVKIGKRRIHRERSQPAARAKLGQLEKHKDYVKRARDFHKKEDRLRAMRESAALKNPDEFYHAMVNERTKQGVHVAKRRIDPEQRSATAFRRFAEQDLAYLTSKAQEERIRIDNLQSSLHLLSDTPATKNTHTIFVDKPSQLTSFDATSHFGLC